MNRRGQAVAFDCILGFIIIVVFLSTLKAPEMPPYTEIVISQKAHDLLNVWQAKKNFLPQELKKDFMKVFGGKNGEIFIGEEKITIGKPAGKKALSFETFFLGENQKPSRLALTVFD